MKTLIALISVFIGSILSNGFNWFEGIIASFIIVIAILNDLHEIGKEAKAEKIKNELIEKLSDDE